MTSAYDLSTATTGRVAGSIVDKLRIANTDVWTAPSGTVYSIENDGAISGMSAFNDSPAVSWLAHQYQNVGPINLSITDLGLYVPDATARNTLNTAMGATGALMGVQFSATEFLAATGYANTIPAGSNKLSKATLVIGWNWFHYSTPLSWPSSTPYIFVGYCLNSGYLFNSTFQTGSKDSSGSVIRLPVNTKRCFYTGANASTFASTSARHYGIDLKAVAA